MLYYLINYPFSKYAKMIFKFPPKFCETYVHLGCVHTSMRNGFHSTYLALFIPKWSPSILIKYDFCRSATGTRGGREECRRRRRCQRVGSAHHRSRVREGDLHVGLSTQYRAGVQDTPQEMEKIKAAVKQSTVRPTTQLLLTFPQFPVGHPAHEDNIPYIPL